MAHLEISRAEPLQTSVAETVPETGQAKLTLIQGGLSESVDASNVESPYDSYDYLASGNMPRGPINEFSKVSFWTGAGLLKRSMEADRQRYEKYLATRKGKLATTACLDTSESL